MQLPHGARGGRPATLLYFGDTQNKNARLVTRVTREAMRHAPDARLALYAGDLVSGGDGEDDNEWGEWFDAAGALPTMLLAAPAAGNHEYFEEFEDTPQERRVLGQPWPLAFALPRNGAPGAEATTYWFDMQDLRVVVLDGTSALDLGTARAQARWPRGALADTPRRWTIAMIHQPMFSAAAGPGQSLLARTPAAGLRAPPGGSGVSGPTTSMAVVAAVPGRGTPQYVVSVAGAKQYLLSPQARATMAPVGEDTQLFQVLRVEGDTLRYESRTASGRLYDAFSLQGPPGERTLVEHPEGRIAPRDCGRSQSPKGREDRCWE